MKRFALVVALVAFALPITAQALTYTHDLTVTGNFSGNGQIELNNPTGNTVANVVGFSFTVTSSAGGLPTPTTFTLADIASLSWSGADSTLSLILESTPVGVLGLVLQAAPGALLGNVCGAFGTNDGSTYCSSGGGGSILVGNSTLVTSAVPEP
ncbi:MAG: hypothetical protein GY788_11980, partial [bacterium]|nr:hypothetical protein [bacterium]